MPLNMPYNIPDYQYHDPDGVGNLLQTVHRGDFGAVDALIAEWERLGSPVHKAMVFLARAACLHWTYQDDKAYRLLASGKQHYAGPETDWGLYCSHNGREPVLPQFLRFELLVLIAVITPARGTEYESAQRALDIAEKLVAAIPDDLGRVLRLRVKITRVYARYNHWNSHRRHTKETNRIRSNIERDLRDILDDPQCTRLLRARAYLLRTRIAGCIGRSDKEHRYARRAIRSLFSDDTENIKSEKPLVNLAPADGTPPYCASFVLAVRILRVLTLNVKEIKFARSPANVMVHPEFAIEAREQPHIEPPASARDRLLEVEGYVHLVSSLAADSETVRHELAACALDLIARRFLDGIAQSGGDGRSEAGSATLTHPEFIDFARALQRLVATCGSPLVRVWGLAIFATIAAHFKLDAASAPLARAQLAYELERSYPGENAFQRSPGGDITCLMIAQAFAGADRGDVGFSLVDRYLREADAINIARAEKSAAVDDSAFSARDQRRKARFLFTRAQAYLQRLNFDEQEALCARLTRSAATENERDDVDATLAGYLKDLRTALATFEAHDMAYAAVETALLLFSYDRTEANAAVAMHYAGRYESRWIGQRALSQLRRLQQIEQPAAALPPVDWNFYWYYCNVDVQEVKKIPGYLQLNDTYDALSKRMKSHAATVLEPLVTARLVELLAQQLHRVALPWLPGGIAANDVPRGNVPVTEFLAHVAHLTDALSRGREQILKSALTPLKLEQAERSGFLHAAMSRAVPAPLVDLVTLLIADLDEYGLTGHPFRAVAGEALRDFSRLTPEEYELAPRDGFILAAFHAGLFPLPGTFENFRTALRSALAGDDVLAHELQLFCDPALPVLEQIGLILNLKSRKVVRDRFQRLQAHVEPYSAPHPRALYVYAAAQIENRPLPLRLLALTDLLRANCGRDAALSERLEAAFAARSRAVKAATDRREDDRKISTGAKKRRPKSPPDAVRLNILEHENDDQPGLTDTVVIERLAEATRAAAGYK